MQSFSVDSGAPIMEYRQSVDDAETTQGHILQEDLFLVIFSLKLFLKLGYCNIHTLDRILWFEGNFYHGFLLGIADLFYYYIGLWLHCFKEMMKMEHITST
ncbi:hypothetical protein SAY87_012731 [Trapa incisa]|uniref:Uncharacterized protein n=1 Tax=Trapa incisa TaxID=236973 RepID=A0AAN7GQL2_9MYRT|nr:hypothetical protein SAY87_012731 [Trapa incisa]